MNFFPGKGHDGLSAKRVCAGCLVYYERGRSPRAPSSTESSAARPSGNAAGSGPEARRSPSPR
jgi:hypothetical protein